MRRRDLHAAMAVTRRPRAIGQGASRNAVAAVVAAPVPGAAIKALHVPGKIG
jgi:hypothetical protein